MTITCMFCAEDEPKSHLEDVFPIWLCKKLAYYAQQAHPGTQAVYENYTYTKLDEFKRDFVESERHPETGELVGARPTAYLLPNVCAECNNGWMGRLEGAVKLLLSGLLEGRSKKLAPYDQQILATWALKTALTYDAAREPRHIPSDLGTNPFYRRGLSLSSSQVAIGWDPDHEPQGDLAHGRFLFPKPAEASVSDNSILVVCFQFNAVLIRVLINFSSGVDKSEPFKTDLPAEPPYWHEIWPSGPRFNWPSTESRKSRFMN